MSPGKLIWTCRLRNAEHATLPSSTTRPNPLVAGGKVYASIFGRGSVCAADRRTGKPIWRTYLDGLAGASVVMAGGQLLAKSARTIYALAPETGEIRWMYTPCNKDGEWVYSEPAVCRGRMYIGDRFGDFHCLDLATGNRLWRRRTSGRGNHQANATALVAGSRVVIANNAGMVVCYDTGSGRTLWRRSIDGGYTGELLAAGSSVLAGRRSLYALDLRTGAIRKQFHYPGKSFTSYTVTKSHIVAVLQDDAAPLENHELVMFARGRESVRRPLPRRVDLRTCQASGLVYGAGVFFYCAIDPASGEILWSREKYIGLPDRVGETLYGLTHNGVLFASRFRS